MKLTVFQSDEGDCLLLTGADGKRILIDGGMSNSYTKHVSPSLNELRESGEKLDVVYVSHIDADHISGVLKMMDDLVAWRVHDFQKQNNNPNHKEPTVLRPPEIASIWHNAFHEQIGKNSGPIENMLAATAIALSGAITKDVKKSAEENQRLSTSIPQAINLSRRVSADQLNIALNPPSKGKLMLVRESKTPVKVGAMNVFIIGPDSKDLDKLKEDWNKWLEANGKKLKELQAKAKADKEKLGTSEVSGFLNSILAQAEQFGNRADVTPPNLASLMLLVEENGKRIILTGDGHADDILKGLNHYGKLDSSGRIHVEVLKVQHHGAIANIHKNFCKAVTADNYVFCGNGSDENPEPEVIKLIVNSRKSDSKKFKLWFNSSSTAANSAANKTHMEKVENLVKELAADSGGLMQSAFIKGSKIELPDL